MAEKKATAKKPETKKATTKKKADEAPAKRKGHVVYGTLNVRSAPKVADGNITRVLNNAAPVEILSEKAGWYQIEDGWVMAKYIEIETESR